jgi:hypothetical protein
MVGGVGSVLTRKEISIKTGITLWGCLGMVEYLLVKDGEEDQELTYGELANVFLLMSIPGLGNIMAFLSGLRYKYRKRYQK